MDTRRQPPRRPPEKSAPGGSYHDSRQVVKLPPPTQRQGILPPQDTIVIDISASHFGAYPSITTRDEEDLDDYFSVQQSYAASVPDAPDFVPIFRLAVADAYAYAFGEQSGWLISICHSAFCPDGTGKLFYHGNQTTRISSPHLVSQHDPIVGGLYEYIPQVGLIAISKIFRVPAVAKSQSSSSQSAMRNRVIQRDGACWVTRQHDPVVLKNSHLFPKRYGDAVITHVLRRRGAQLGDGETVSAHSPQVSVLLFASLDIAVDILKLGFRRQPGGPPDVHLCHNFNYDKRHIQTFLYTEVMPGIPIPILHGYAITRPDMNNPDRVFDEAIEYHYLQCIIEAFGTDEYKNLHNIHLMERPREDSTRGRSDDEPGPSTPGGEPLLLSEVFELAGLFQKEDIEAHRKRIATERWVEQGRQNN